MAVRREEASVQKRSGRISGGVGRLVVSMLLAMGCASEGRDSATVDSPDAAVASELPTDVLAAQVVVLRLHAELLEVMREAPELGYVGRVARLESVAKETFDIPLMARRSFGAGWNDLTPEQRQLWVTTFSRFHLSSIADIRDRYRGQQYRLLGWEQPMQDVVLVKSILDYPGRAVDIHIDYRVRRASLQSRIVDVHQPPAVSEVAMRRAEYQLLLERDGFDGLIEEMNARIAQRSEP
jgi:phospholipid transport system substrate-binding protein